MPEKTRRTCVVCKKKAHPSTLLRFILEQTSKRFLLDIEKTKPGRGVYCHPDVGCVSSKKTLEAFKYSFRKEKEDLVTSSKSLKEVILAGLPDEQAVVRAQGKRKEWFESVAKLASLLSVEKEVKKDNRQRIRL